MSRFCWVLWGFSGLHNLRTYKRFLYIAIYQGLDPTGSSQAASQALVTQLRVTKVLETVRKYWHGRATH